MVCDEAEGGRKPRSTRLSTALGVVVALLMPFVAHAQTFSYGPILGRGARPDCMIVKWGTGSSTDPTQLSYRLMGANQFQIVTGALSRDHEIELCGLSQNSLYEYFVTSGAAVSATYTWATCPPAGKPMNLVFYGDNRGGVSVHTTIIARIKTLAPDIVFQSGDIRGDGTYSGYLSEFFPVVKELVARTPMMAVPGNHDAMTTLSSNYGLLFPSPRQSPNDPWQPYYAFSCGNVRFIALDSNNVSGSAQNTFLMQQLGVAKADATIDHVLVWFHHAAYSTGSHGDKVSVQQYWVPLFSDPANKVTAVFSGHDHIYDRLTNGSSVVYIVTGGGGALLNTLTGTSAATSLVAKMSYNYVSAHIDGKTVVATAYDELGTQFDTWTVTKMPLLDGGVAPTDLAMAPMDLAMDPPDVAMVPVDLTMDPPDLAMAPVDSAMAPVDLSMAPSDLAMAPMDLAMEPADLAMAPPDLVSKPIDLAALAVDFSVKPGDLAVPVDLRVGPFDQAAKPLDLVLHSLDLAAKDGAGLAADLVVAPGDAAMADMAIDAALATQIPDAALANHLPVMAGCVLAPRSSHSAALLVIAAIALVCRFLRRQN